MSATPAPTRFFLVRHGAVAEEWRGRVYGDLDVPLSPQGEQEARAAAALLAGRPLAAVIGSGLARAEFGAALLRDGRGLPRRDEPSLKEVSRGAWAGLALPEIERHSPGAWERWWHDPERERPPDGGESLADLAARVVPCLERLAREHAGQEVAVVAHSWVVRVAACHALGLAPGAATRLSVATGSVAAIDWPCGRPGELARPVLVGLAVDLPPDRARTWLRGPRRSDSAVGD